MVVEVISPNDRWERIRQKIADYFSIDVEQVWVIEPSSRTLLVYRSTAHIQEFNETDTLIGAGILEGFRLNIAELFAE